MGLLVRDRLSRSLWPDCCDTSKAAIGQRWRCGALAPAATVCRVDWLPDHQIEDDAAPAGGRNSDVKLAAIPVKDRPPCWR